MKKILSAFLIIYFIFLNNLCFAGTYWSDNIYPYDKHENFNRKVFNMNLKLNRVVVKKVHIIWASIFPEFVINALTRVYTNLEYPKRAVSCLLQKDINAMGHETGRFLINTTLGLAGIIDAAYKIFKLEPYNEDMEQAFSKLKMKQGTYIVLPFVSSVTSRDIIGRIFDFFLTPSTYISSPIAAAIKLGLLINRTTKIQPVIKMVESNFADPYDIAKKAYFINKDIKIKNYDREKVLSKIKFEDDSKLVYKTEDKKVSGRIKNEKYVGKYNVNLNPDIFLNNYNPKSPICDSLRTILFDIKNEHNSIWSEISIWNRSFDKKLKTASVEIISGQPKYNFKYVLQKNKKSPLAIIFPSIGAGVDSAHSANFAKIFYNEGYSVIILGSHFQWEFSNSLEKGYYPGNIKNDIKYISMLVNNSVDFVSKKHKMMFTNKTAFATSLGAYSILFLANKQMEDNSNYIDKFIAISPPIELDYAMDKLDEIMNTAKNQQNSDSVQIIGAKLTKAYNNKKDLIKNTNNLPLTNYEANMINAYIFHQKLSDIVYAAETRKNPDTDKKALYDEIEDMNYNSYIKKYISVNYSAHELKNATKLKAISNYLISKDNYVIFHSLDDYLTNKNQLKELKEYAGDKLILLNNGSHLGFLYRDEFIEALKQEIKIKNL